ncbi:hypothetical protein ACRALDRAFT_1064588 [Sodiomyces alcalophilus JCM 7366]|uniref:uncharacterized protein n=1 Tax=Sodiomyces alcalophilus JCM 7366 TaxID=591952 RepID=UPI0039B56C0F
MSRVLYRLNSSLGTLGHFANIFRHDSSAEQHHIRQYSEGLIRELQHGSELMRDDVRNLSLSDVATLRDKVAQLRDTSSALAVYLLAKKAEFEVAGMCDEVRGRMDAVTDQAGVFIGDVIDRVSDEAAWLVKAMASAVTAPLTEVDGAYAVGGCVDDG